MGKRGRPRSPGKRSKTGRLLEQFIKGNERAEERKATFGTNGWDQIGRAYMAGLLGEGDTAKDRLDAARRYAKAHHELWGRGYRCPLDRSPRASNENEPDELAERLIERRHRLTAQAAAINATHCGSFFDQLVDPSRLHTDHDIYWVAGLIETALANRGRKDKLPQDMGHARLLEAALRGLDALVAFRATGSRTGYQRRAA